MRVLPPRHRSSGTRLTLAFQNTYPIGLPSTWSSTNLTRCPSRLRRPLSRPMACTIEFNWSIRMRTLSLVPSRGRAVPFPPFMRAIPMDPLPRSVRKPVVPLNFLAGKLICLACFTVPSAVHVGLEVPSLMQSLPPASTCRARVLTGPLRRKITSDDAFPLSARGCTQSWLIPPLASRCGEQQRFTLLH